MKLLLKWLLSAIALLAVAYLYSGVTVTSFTSALIQADKVGANLSETLRAQAGSDNSIDLIWTLRWK